MNTNFVVTVVRKIITQTTVLHHHGCAMFFMEGALCGTRVRWGGSNALLNYAETKWKLP